MQADNQYIYTSHVTRNTGFGSATHQNMLVELNPVITAENREKPGSCLAEFRLIIMKGRMYDPAIGMFLSPDNYIQAPDFSQNYNRYSYAFNNPLNFTDPTGNKIEENLQDIIRNLWNSPHGGKWENGEYTYYNSEGEAEADFVDYNNANNSWDNVSIENSYEFYQRHAESLAAISKFGNIFAETVSKNHWDKFFNHFEPKKSGNEKPRENDEDFDLNPDDPPGRKVKGGSAANSGSGPIIL